MPNVTRDIQTQKDLLAKLKSDHDIAIQAGETNRVAEIDAQVNKANAEIKRLEKLL